MTDIQTARRTVAEFVAEQNAWSRRTFGPGQRTEGFCKHVEKELAEIRANPTDLVEWIDVIILAVDAAGRLGHSPEEIEAALWAKHKTNLARRWGPPAADDQPNEHIR